MLGISVEKTAVNTKLLFLVAASLCSGKFGHRRLIGRPSSVGFQRFCLIFIRLLISRDSTMMGLVRVIGFRV